MEDESRSLMARPQRLGFLPTLWFWEAWGMERPLVSGFVGMLLTAVGLLVCHLLLALDYPLAAILATPLIPWVGYGLLERALRQAVQRRRARQPAALPACPPHERR